jgi:tetratricopeptide (TPR) repeat protein
VIKLCARGATPISAHSAESTPAAVADHEHFTELARNSPGRIYGCELACSEQFSWRAWHALTSSWSDLGDLHLGTDRAQDAIPLYFQALELTPTLWEMRTGLVEALMATKQCPVAKALLQELLAERPHAGQVHYQLGKVCFALNEMDSAIRHFEQAIALNPDDADKRYWVGGIKQTMGDIDAAEAPYTAATQIRPLVRRQAIKRPPDFRLLTLYAPFNADTPIQYLFKDATYDIDTLAFFGPGEPDSSSIGDIHVIFNLISDADQAKATLPTAARLAEKLGKPVVNAPSKILRTTREAVADLLSDIPACRVPRALRFDAGTDVPVAALARLLPSKFPVLTRPASTHGGGDFEKIESLDELARFSRAASRRRPLRYRICRLRRLQRWPFPQIPLRRRRGPALPSCDRKRPEGAPRLDRYGQPAPDAAGGSGIPRQSRRHLQCCALSSAARGPRALRA